MRRVEGYIEYLRMIRQGKRRLMSLILVLSIGISGNVFWLMKGIGTALTDDPVCGLEEHVHTDDCYEGEGDDRVLICGMEEHVHTDACYVTSDEPRENRTDWEATLPPDSGDRSLNIANIAMSQTGYTENADNYTRYGDWYGNPTGDWNVMFVSFALHYAGVSESEIPYGSGAWAWQVALDEKGLINKEDRSTNIGDILLIDSDADGKCDRAGIVISVEDDNISVIEGDIDGAVGTVTYNTDDTSIFGYVTLNQEITEPANTATQEEATQADQTPATPVTFEATTASGITVTVSAEEGAFPENTSMTADDVATEDIINAASETITDSRVIVDAVAVDIKFTGEDGVEIEPAEGRRVDVNITLPEDKKLEGNEYALIHLTEDGAENVNDCQVTEGNAVFTADSFSIYVLTALGERYKDEVHEWIGEMSWLPDPGPYIYNRPFMPYLMSIDDTLTLVAYCTSNTVDFVISDEDVLQAQGDRIISYDEDLQRYRIQKSFKSLASGTANIGIDFNGDGQLTPFTDLDHAAECECFYISVYGDKVTATSEVRSFNFINDPSLANYTHDNPYRIDTYIGNTISLVRNSELAEFYFIDEYGDRVDGSNILRFDYSETSGSDIICHYTIIGEGVQGIQTEYQGQLRPMYIEGLRRNWLDHADIEVTDGGFYTTSRIFNENGVLKKTETKYNSYVCGVNDCILYQADGSYVQFYYDNGTDNEKYDPASVHGYLTDDYWQNPNIRPGQSQYELTSKYNKDTGTSSNKKFYLEDVDHAFFDVQLVLRPGDIKTYSWNGTEWVEDANSHITYQYDEDLEKWTMTDSTGTYVVDDIGALEQTIDSATFNLNRTAVVDAHNKCPNHSGLDFTIKATSATVVIEANKNLVGGVLQGNDFTYELCDYDDPDTVVATAQNDVDGYIIFDGMEFEQPGTYKFILRERTGTDPKIEYDTTKYTLIVEVTDPQTTQSSMGTGYITKITVLKNDQAQQLDDYSIVFNNIKKFTLPDTGGTGLIPVFAGGAALITTSVVMLVKRKRDEESDPQNSL